MNNISEMTAEQWKETLEEAKDELLSMEEWDGECWKTMFNWFAENVPEADPWDCLLAFIKLSLMKGDGNG